MRPIACLGVAAALAAPALALDQIPGEVAIRAGWYESQRFTYEPTSTRTTLRGPQLGLDYPVQKSADGRSVLRISPTVVFGGAGSSGADVDATIYRLQATLRTSQVNKPFYTVAGVGFSTTQGRGGSSFSKAWRFNGSVAVGYDFARSGRDSRLGRVGGAVPFVQVGYQMGSRETRGLEFEAGVRF